MDHTPLPPPRLLVIDDDTILLRRIMKRLERHGYQVTGAANGMEGLEKARQLPFDLIMVDHRMPMMGGLEVIRHLGELEEAPPVVMVTGAGDEAVAVEAMKLGASDYIVKDSDGVYLEIFPVVIDQALGRRRLLRDKLRAEAELRKSEERYRLLFTRMLDGFVLLDSTPDSTCPDCSFRFMEINPAFGRLFAVTPEALLGHCVCRLGSISGEAWFPYLEQVRDSGEGCQFELPIDSDRLFLQVAAYIPTPGRIAVIFEDVTARKRYEAELERLATTDPLTGVSNRADFFTRVENEVARLSRYQGTSSLLMLDLDHFKQVNDRYGHTTGDEVLIAVATTIRQSLRQVDVVGRYGGEEFVVPLPETGLTEARIVAERIRQRVSELEVPAGAELVTLTTSCGVALLEAGGEGKVVRVLEQADQALYRAKRGGRNRTELHGGQPDQTSPSPEAVTLARRQE